MAGKQVAFVVLSVLMCLSLVALNQRLHIWELDSNYHSLNQSTALYANKPKEDHFNSEETNVFEGVDWSVLTDRIINCSRPFVLMYPNGELGNLLGEATHVLAIRIKYKVQVGVRKDMYDHLMASFPNFPLPPLPQECIDRNREIRGMRLHDAESYIALNGLDIIIGIGLNPCHPAFFIQYRSLLRFFYRFHTSVQESAERYRDLLLQKWRKKMEAASVKDGTIQAPGDERPVVIAVHVRRRGYIYHMRVVHGSKVVEPIYFDDALAFARKRYGKVAFLVVSDDIPWSRENVVERHPDAVALDDPISRDEDMALMALSDHFIFGLGTFAMWGGILSKGEIIYATNVSYDLSRPYEIEVWANATNHESFIPLLYRKPYEEVQL